MFVNPEGRHPDGPHPPRPQGRRGRGGHRGPGPGAADRRHGGRHGGRGGGRGRTQRGDVRIATLLLLAENPMHGYQIMQAMADRTDGAWRPSPGAIYPTLAQLEDEGLVSTQVDGGRKLATLTAQGHEHVEEHRAGWGDPFGQVSGQEPGPDLRGPLRELHVAARSVAVTGSAAQVEAAAAVLTEARRSLYLILAGEPGGGEGG